MPDTLRLLHLSEADAASIPFFKAVGCDQCSHTGYRGRIGIYEVMRVNERVRRMIAQKAGEDTIREAALASGMLSLGEDGLAKVKAGVTTPEELLRVVTEVREMRTLCGGCGNAVAIDFVACPSCGHRLQNACGKCNRTLQPGWNFCPYCASSSEPKPKSKSKRLRAGESSDLPAPTRVTEFKKA
jgi:RNA polymerase subunit RPABC4/transcription elongation factor Spt4